MLIQFQLPQSKQLGDVYLTVAISPLGASGVDEGVSKSSGSIPIVIAPLTEVVFPDKSLDCVYCDAGL